MSAAILVVDDKENMLKLFERMLGERYRVTTAASGEQALALLARERFSLVVSDIRMPGADGFEVLRRVKEASPDTEVILMTAYATVPMAVDAMKQGAYDYIQKPFDPDEATLLVGRALESREAKRAQAPAAPERLEALIAASPAMRETFRLLLQASQLGITVLLSGESGTGKELAARALHARGPRRERAFVAVNCGAVPADLVESELFGHVKGAFTGATADRRGLFEEAEGGTLFLDEIGELPLQAQVKLNRALQEREIRRVGDSRAAAVDVRVVAATHRDLRAEVAAGRFREDLFYRLNVFPIRMPALRERPEDVAVLAAHFLERFARVHGRPARGFTPEALRALAGYAWPGNVRELENAVERAVAVCERERLGAEDLPPELLAGRPGPLPATELTKLPWREAVELARERVSRDYLAALMTDFHGNVTRAAERAGVERETLHRLLKKHGLRSDDFKREE